MVLEYIIYNSRRCARKKCAQRRCIHWFPCCYSHKTFQGVPLDSLGVGAIESGRIIAPDHRQHRQEAPKRNLATLAAFLRFLDGFLWNGGVGGCLYSF